MTLEELKRFDLIYLASPYSKYPDGIWQAFTDVCLVAADLLKAGVKVYSPIAHTHSIAAHGQIDPLDHSIWLPFDQAIMNKSDALVVATMASWGISVGIAHEIADFKARGMPVFYLDPDSMKVTERP